MDYFRPIPQVDSARPDGALPVAGGWAWFTHVEHLRRGAAPVIRPADSLPEDIRVALSGPRAPVLGLGLEQPRIMGILNATPDSFSDSGTFRGAASGVAHGQRMIEEGADILDIGGESTRPGAVTVPAEAEVARVQPVIAALRAGSAVPISVDTRKLAVAEAAVDAGAQMVNDVSGLTHDRGLAGFCISRGLPVCIMHARGDPETMQNDPRYDDVLLDVYDFLAAQVAMLEEAGLPRSAVIVDPGIGFGKTFDHNLALLNRISLFHGLGCPVLLGASRKGFIRDIGKAPDPTRRVPGSLAVALAAVAQGVQILRVHDVAETRQALSLAGAVRAGAWDGT